jgi:hypothetical protein
MKKQKLKICIVSGLLQLVFIGNESKAVASVVLHTCNPRAWEAEAGGL